MFKNKKINTLVVGQGIAGTLVAFNLYLHKIPFLVIDPAEVNTSSRIAAGMFTPVSGKRKTIQPIIDEQISLAIKIYKEIGQLLGTTILHLQNIYQVYHSITEQNELLAKSTNAQSGKYIIANPKPVAGIKQDFGACEITHSGWVDCGLFINSFAQWLKQNDALIEEGFLHKDLKTGNGIMQYHGIEFTNIIFCEGYHTINNPFFKNEHIIPCKGDVLTIKYDQPATGRIIKKDGIYLVATGDKKFKAGSTYQWNNCNTEPDEASKKLIESKLGEMLENNFTTIGHQSAIRPTTQNRTVIAKQHSQHPGMFMLNGLGTKGILQGPWWARHLVRMVEEG